MSVTLPLQPTADDLAHLESDTAKKLWPHLQNPADPIRRRIIMERAVIRRACTDMLAAGLQLRVYDGEEWATEWTDSLDAVMASICACDEEWIHVRQPFHTEPGKFHRLGSIYLVYGNAGWEVIADNAVALEPHLAGATAFADQLADAEGADLRIQAGEAARGA